MTVRSRIFLITSLVILQWALYLIIFFLIMEALPGCSWSTTGEWRCTGDAFSFSYNLAVFSAALCAVILPPIILRFIKKPQLRWRELIINQALVFLISIVIVVTLIVITLPGPTGA